jgi:glycosyltransferase involved in cell wall biosynthesis
MTISIAIATLNEGPDLEATIALLAASHRPVKEIVVVDDNSQDAVEPRLARWSGLCSVHTNRTHAGPGPSKHRAASMCSGDWIVVMDSHMRPPYDWINLWEKDFDLHPHAVFSPLSLAFQTRDGFRGIGGSFNSSPEKFWRAVWFVHDKKPGLESIAVPTVIGGCYAMRRDTMSFLGGYCPLLIGYGLEEEWIGLRAFLLGIECRVSPSVPMPHHYSRDLDMTPKNPSRVPSFRNEYNRHVMAACLFTEETYSAYVRSMGLSEPCRARLAEHADEIGRVRDYLQSRRVRSDADFARIGIVHPT